MDSPDDFEEWLADIKRRVAEGRVPADCLRAVLMMRASTARDAERREWALRRLEDEDPAAAARLQELFEDEETAP
jgi:hypothetical protein